MPCQSEIQVVSSYRHLVRSIIRSRHLLHDLEGPITGAVVGQDLQRLVGLGERALDRLADVLLLGL